MIYTIITGILAGFIASKLMKDEGSGCWIDLFLGLVGGWVGGNVLGWLGFSVGSGIVAQIITAVIGAVIVIWLFNLIRGKK